LAASVPTADDVKKDLIKSIQEEEVATTAYFVRGRKAKRAGDEKTSDLYKHIRQEEEHHRDELLKRNYELRNPQYSTTVSRHEYWVKIKDPGNTSFTEGSIVPYEEFEKENKKVIERGEKPASIVIRYSYGPGNGHPLSDIDLDKLAKTEGDPLSKFCCRQCGECAPNELLEEGKFPERMAWLRNHYNERHPGMWGNVTELTPARDTEYLPDSPEYLTKTIEASGWREQLDMAFQEAMVRVGQKV